MVCVKKKKVVHVYHNPKPTCLLCTQTVAVCKADHMKTVLQGIAQKFQLQSAFLKLQTEGNSIGAVIYKTTSMQENAIATSRCGLEPGKGQKKPFTYTELLKTCAIGINVRTIKISMPIGLIIYSVF